MALPLLLAAGATLLGTAISAYGQHEQSEAEAEAARENARLGRLMAADTILRGNREAAAVRSAGTAMISQQKATFAASGIDPGVGSPLAIMAGTRALSEYDALLTENNAAREAWGLRTQGAQYMRQAKAAQRSGRFAVAGSLLAGAAQSASMGYRGGAFGGV